MKFIRKNGRIIPIREKKDYGAKDIAKGAGVAGAGSIFAGHKIRKMETLGRYEVFKAGKMTDMAKTFARKQKFYKRVGIGVHSISTFLFFRGFSKLLSDGKKEKETTATKDAASLIAGELATRATQSGTKFGFNKFSPWWSKNKFRILKKVL